VIPRPTSAERPAFANWDNWLPYDCPYVEDIDWWEQFNPPWVQGVVNLPVDLARTEAFHRLDTRVRCGAYEKTTGGVYGGVPFQRVDTQRTWATKVWEAKTPPSSVRGFFPSTTVPLPLWVRRFGDPTVTGTDAQSYLVDGQAGKYYELAAFGPTVWPFTWIAPWRADRVMVWDLKRDWRLQRRGAINAARFPILPMIPRVEEYEAGFIGHALHYVCAGYSPAFIPPAAGSDGDVSGHPIRAGARLRLTDAAIRRLAPNTMHDRVLIDCLSTFGAIADDKTDPKAGDMIRQPMDPRLDITLELRRTDFEVLA
jgi:hypothetical protein